MSKFLSYNETDMKIITPLTNRATIIGVLNNNFFPVKAEPEIPKPNPWPEEPEDPNPEDKEEEKEGNEGESEDLNNLPI